MKHLQVTIEIPQSERDELTEIIIAELGDLGFDGFWQDEQTLVAYIDREQPFPKLAFEQVLKQYELGDYKIEELEDKNWNAQWESDYSITEVEELCLIKAPFHKDIREENYLYKGGLTQFIKRNWDRNLVTY